jgi:hypothetical protein
VRIFDSQKPGFPGVPPLARPLRAPSIPLRPTGFKKWFHFGTGSPVIVFLCAADTLLPCSRGKRLIPTLERF